MAIRTARLPDTLEAKLQQITKETGLSCSEVMHLLVLHADVELIQRLRECLPRHQWKRPTLNAGQE